MCKSIILTYFATFFVFYFVRFVVSRISSLKLQSFFSEIRQSARLSLPLIASNVVQASSGFLGTLMVAHLGRDYLAANALGASVYFTLIVFLFGVLSAIGVLVAQNLGAKNKVGIELAVSQGFLLALLFAIPMVILVWFAPTLLALSGESHNIVLLTTQYLHAVIWCIVPLALLIAMEQFLIGLGYTKFVLWVSLAEVPFEILASYVLVFGKFGFPKCGIAGVGYGFCIVFTATAIGLAIFLAKSKACREYKIFSYIFRVNAKYFQELLRIGWPIGCMYVIEVALLAVLAFLMGKLGSDQLAAHQIARQYLMLGMMIVFAISQVATIRIGYAVGRQDKPAVNRAILANLSFGFCLTALIAICLMVFAKDFIGLDINIANPQYVTLIHYAEIFFIFCGFALVFDTFRFIAIGALRGLKDTRAPMYISIFTYWFIALPLAYWFGFGLHLGGIGLWLGLVIGIFVGAVILLLRFKKLSKKVDLQKLMI